VAADPYKYFRVEARELVEQLGQGMLELEKGTSAELVARLLRLAHTLKGAARVVKAREIAEHAHALEDGLAPLRDGQGAVSRDQVDSALALIDAMGKRLAELGQPPPAEAGPAPARPAVEEHPRTVRADVEEMDALLEGIAETYNEIVGLRRGVAKLERARTLIELLADQLSARRGGAEFDGGQQQRRAASLVEELRGLFAGGLRGVASGVERVERELSQVRDSAEQLRLAPAGALFGTLERAARDAAEASGKRVQFSAGGGELRLEADLLSSIQGALIQVVKNAVAHGIELPAAREAAGKPRAGKVSVQIARRGRNVSFRCSDDGKGIDLDAVIENAIRKGASAHELSRLDQKQLLQLLIRGGMSSSASVTAVAGRGIGLDIVRETVKRLGGEVRVGAEPGQGASFDLVVPMSLAVLDVLSVQSGERVIAIPLEAVVATRRVTASEITGTDRGESVIHEGNMVSLLELWRLLGAEAGGRARAFSVVLLKGERGLCALAVERLLGSAEIGFRPLPLLAVADPVIAGIYLNAEGNAELVLDPEAIVERAFHGEARAVVHEAPRLPVLVIDDSLTTRMLEQSILESAGFDVDVAVSAEDGLESARRKRYSLFLVDVEMPGMDGFAFVEQIRKDPLLHDTPAILVTSRSSAQDLERGREVGAQGYMVKSEFDQNALLSRINQLVG
jgi:two-component system, chemotaxis family, sensor kinase CheA